MHFCSRIDNNHFLLFIFTQIKTENLNQILDLIASESEQFVLKPQREGGGNNIYKSDIK